MSELNQSLLRLDRDQSKSPGALLVIATRRLQRSFADGLSAEAVEDLWEPGMRYADSALEDEALLRRIQQKLAKRCKKSKTRGRRATSPKSCCA